MYSKIKLNIGFTLLEIIVTIFILSILAVIAVPSYQNYLAKSEINRCYNYLSSTRLVADNLIQLNNGAADTITINDLGANAATAANSCDAGFVITNSTAGGNLTLSGASSVPGQNNSIVLSFVRSGADGTWSCSSNAASSELTPSFCP